MLQVPPPMSEFLNQQARTLPQFVKPPELKEAWTRQEIEWVKRLLNVIMGGLGLFILLTGNWLSLLLWVLGIIGLKLGINWLFKTVIPDYFLLIRQQHQSHQKQQHQWQKAQHLITRHQQRQLRQFLKGKVKRGRGRKLISLDAHQQNFVNTLISQFSHCEIKLGEVLEIEHNTFVLDITLVEPLTGLAIAILFPNEYGESFKERLLEYYWVVADYHREHPRALIDSLNKLLYPKSYPAPKLDNNS